MSARAVRSPVAPPARERLRLLVKEAGSGPLTSAEAAAFDETMIIAQMQGESALAFARRAHERIAASERAGRHFDSTVLVAGDRCEPDQRVARRTIARSIAAHAQLHGGQTELVLETNAGPGAEQRHDFLSLVDELLASSDARPMPVRLRFTAASLPAAQPESGVFWSTPPVSS